MKNRNNYSHNVLEKRLIFPIGARLKHKDVYLNSLTDKIIVVGYEDDNPVICVRYTGDLAKNADSNAFLIDIQSINTREIDNFVYDMNFCPPTRPIHSINEEDLEYLAAALYYNDSVCCKMMAINPDNTIIYSQDERSFVEATVHTFSAETQSVLESLGYDIYYRNE